MRRLTAILMTVILTSGLLCACGATAERSEPAESPSAAPAVLTAVPTATAEPEPTGVPGTLTIPQAREGWAEAYLAFLDNNADIFAALWPEGLSGAGFIDLDLDGTPEMVLFDQGAAAAMGAHLFDLDDEGVWCVSSGLDSAVGAFGDKHFTPVSACAVFFESFRLSRTEEGWGFWINSANGTLETAWNEIIRFDSRDGILTPVSVCAQYLENDPETGLVLTESYTLGGEETNKAGYEAAASVHLDGEDVGYEAKGLFLWNDMDAYGGGWDGFMAMARDAAEAYTPIPETVTLVSQEG